MSDHFALSSKRLQRLPFLVLPMALKCYRTLPGLSFQPHLLVPLS